MANQVTLEREEIIFKKQQRKGSEQWFVRIACNFFQARIYGPFVDEHEAESFMEGAEFELRKLLDCQLANNSKYPNLSLPCIEL